MIVTESSEPFQASLSAWNPFHGGSHRQFIQSITDRSVHQWTVLTGKPVHWKWRIRSSALALASAAKKSADQNGLPDLVFCTSMLDLPAWRGLLGSHPLTAIPTVLYFHENQWTYPVSPSASPDFHYGYTNLISAIAADQCVFNSRFNRDEFLSGSATFLHRMPDTRDAHDLDSIREKSVVIPPGFEWDQAAATKRAGGRNLRDGRVVRIGWVSRWEHDKRPDRLLEFADRLSARGVDARWVLLGARPPNAPKSLIDFRAAHRQRIEHDGFASSRAEYEDWLSQLDLVLSTADHEFFGIAVCEAMAAGAIPIVPDRLSYPEFVPPQCRWETLDQAVHQVLAIADKNDRLSLQHQCQSAVKDLHAKVCVERLDSLIARL